MNNNVILLFLILSFLVNVYFIIFIIDENTHTLVYNKSDCECNKWHIRTISENVANLRKYKRTEWDCSNMTEELVRELSLAGYETEYIHACYNDIPHAITKVCFFIESTTGKQIRPDVFKEHYRIRNSIYEGCKNGKNKT